jgi:hypothetical protein
MNTNFLVDDKDNSFKKLKSVKTFTAGDVLMDFSSAQILPEPDYTSIDLHDCHIYHPIGRYINHSCEPTTYVDTKLKQLIANLDIKPDDEITFNYLSSERKIILPFDCVCLSPRCIGRIEKYA